MRTAFFSAAVITGLAMAGCVGQHPAATFPSATAKTETLAPSVPVPKQQLIVTPDQSLFGKVVSVNASLRFAVLNFPIGHFPAQDQIMAVYHGNLKVGEVKITGPQRDDNVVADLAAGDAEAGDEVREK